MRLLGFFRAPLDVWYHASYRLPISGLDASHGLEPRRADYAAWYLLEQGRLKAHALRSPEPADFDELAWVHDEAYLESLERPEVLARIFGVDPSDVPVDGVMDSVRRACGGTVEAARRALQTRRPALNLLGGFHHAGRARGGGNCPVNDLAVAIAAVRREGFRGKVWVLDLDAHPPDGTADCFAGDPDVRISSLSGSDWGPLPGVDETVVPPGSGDAAYLERLEETLRRRPPADLALVVAGGDVLAHDRFGTLALTLEGVRRRDARVAEVLRGVPSVWLPGGGYRVDAWQVLAGTALVLLGRPRERIRARSDPLRWQFSRIARSIPPSALHPSEELLSDADLSDLFGGGARTAPRLLGFYTAQGFEYVLHRYGFFEQLRRLGYGRFGVALDDTGAGDRARLWGEAESSTHLLMEMVVDRKVVCGASVVFVNWLTLRNPRARFSAVRPALPNQEVPGLGMAREAAEMFGLMAQRLGLQGVAFRPSSYHLAYAVRAVARFADPQRQGRFEALVRDLQGLSLLDASRAVERGEVYLDGAPYAWEASEMAAWVDPSRGHQGAEAVEAAREGTRFSLKVETAGDPSSTP